MADELARHPSQLCDMVRDAAADAGADPARTDPLDINKTARHAIAAAVIPLSVDEMVEGSGREAQLRGSRISVGVGSTGAFRMQQVRGLYFAAREVRSRHSPESIEGSSENTVKWWPALETAYSQLGQIARGASRTRIPNEGVDLFTAASSTTMAAIMPSYFHFIRAQIDLDAAPETIHDERLRAAHDASHLVTSLAARHLNEFEAAPKSEIFDGSVSLVPHPRDPRHYMPRIESLEGRQRVFPQIGNLGNVRLKCPALLPYEQSATAPDADAQPRVDSPLARLTMPPSTPPAPSIYSKRISTRPPQRQAALRYCRDHGTVCPCCTSELNTRHRFRKRSASACARCATS